MTGEAPAVAAFAGVVLLNGPSGSLIGEVAEVMRSRWPLPAFDATRVGLLVQRGLPPGQRAGDMEALPTWLPTVVDMAQRYARRHGPVAVLTATLTSRFHLEGLLRDLAARRLLVAHIVATEAEDALRSRVFDQGGPTSAQRWVLSHAHDELAALAEIAATSAVDGRLDLTGQAPDELAEEVARILVRLRWMSPEGRWATTVEAWTDA